MSLKNENSLKNKNNNNFNININNSSKKRKSVSNFMPKFFEYKKTNSFLKQSNSITNNNTNISNNNNNNKNSKYNNTNVNSNLFKYKRLNRAGKAKSSNSLKNFSNSDVMGSNINFKEEKDKEKEKEKKSHKTLFRKTKSFNSDDEISKRDRKHLK